MWYMNYIAIKLLTEIIESELSQTLASLPPTPSLLHQGDLQSGCWTCWRAAICQNPSDNRCRERAASGTGDNPHPCPKHIKKSSPGTAYSWVVSRLLPAMEGTAGDIATTSSERLNWIPECDTCLLGNMWNHLFHIRPALCFYSRIF